MESNDSPEIPDRRETSDIPEPSARDVSLLMTSKAGSEYRLSRKLYDQMYRHIKCEMILLPFSVPAALWEDKGLSDWLILNTSRHVNRKCHIRAKGE